MKLIRKAVILLTLICLSVLLASVLSSCSECAHTSCTSWVTTKEATCAEAGIKERSCLECGEVFTSSVNKKSHSYGKYLADGNGTCTYIGSLTATCENCGEKKSKMDDGNPYGHTYFDGVCSTCGDTLTLVGSYDASATSSDSVTVKVYRSLDGHYELDVVGTGHMKDLAEGEHAPWAEYKSNISVLHIYSGVESIGDRAFFELDVLSQIDLEAGLKSVGKNAFPELFTPSITRVYDMATWVSLEFEDGGVPSLYMTGLIYVGKVEVDENGAKRLTNKSTRIENLIIPEGVETIGSYAFYQNNHITTVTLPASLKSIGSYAFYECGAIEEVYTPALSAWCGISFAERYANPLIYGRNLFVDGELLTSLTLGDGISSLERGAFEGCTSLVDLVVKGGISTIPDYAFYNCSGLRTITVEEGLESIGSFAFYGAASLTDIKLPDSLTNLSSDAFRNCKSLISADMGDGLEKISSSAFRDCYQLMHLELGTSITDIATDAFAGCIKIYEIENRSSLDVGSYELADNALRVYSTDEESKLTVIEQSDDASETVAGTGLILYRDADTVLVVGYIGIRDNLTLSSDVVGSSFSIYKNAFRNTHVTALTVGKGVVRMYDDAFADVAFLSVNVLDLGDWCGIVFDSYTANPLYLAKELRLENSTKETLKVTIPDGVSKINAFAFAGLGQITEFKIPESVSSIGEGAFMECISAMRTTGGVSYIGKWIVSLDKAEGSATLAIDTVGVVDGAFDGCKVDSFITNAKLLHLIPTQLAASLNIIGGTLNADTFVPFTALTSLSISSSVTLPDEEFKSVNVTKLSATKNALALFRGAPITNLTVIGGSLNRADIEPFTALTALAIESGVKSVAAGTFKNLTSLRTVSVRGGLTSLPSELFAGCTSLTDVTLHTGLLSMSKDAFDGCTSLIQTENGVSYVAGWIIDADSSAESLVIRADTVGIAGGVFGSDSSLKTVYYLERQTAYNKIKFNSKDNSAIISARIYFFVETKPNSSGSFWHYVDGVPTVWEV